MYVYLSHHYTFRVVSLATLPLFVQLPVPHNEPVCLFLYVCMFVCLYVCLSISVCMYACLSVCLSISVCLCVCRIPQSPHVEVRGHHTGIARYLRIPQKQPTALGLQSLVCIEH